MKRSATNLKIAASILALLSSAAAADTAVWQQLPSLREPKGDLACGFVGERLVVVGGTTWREGRKYYLSDVERYDPSSGRWSQGPDAEVPVANAIPGVFGDRLVCVAGTTGRAAFAGLLSVAATGPVTVNRDGIAVPAVLATGGRVGDEIIVIGGGPDDSNLAGLGATVVAWDHRTGTSRQLAPYPGPGFGIAASVVLNGNVYVFGGTKWDGQNRRVENLRTAWALDVKANHWQRLHDVPDAVRGLAAVVLDDRHIYVGGGYSDHQGGFSAAAWVFDVVGNSFRPAPPLPVSAVVNLVVCDGDVYCLGGEDQPRHRIATVFRAAPNKLCP